MVIERCSLFSGTKRKVGIVVKGQQKDICGDGTVQYLDSGGDV